MKPEKENKVTPGAGPVNPYFTANNIYQYMEDKNMIDIKHALYMSDTINCDYNDILVIDFATPAGGRGHFEVKMFALFPAAPGKMKLVLDMINKADDPQGTAETLYNHLKLCADFLQTIRDKNDAGRNDNAMIKARAEYTAELKKYNANIAALCKYYDFEAAEDPENIKTKKCDVVTMIYDGTRKAVNKAGVRFEKYGVVFHAYKDTRSKETQIILPAFGLACCSYYGPLKDAPHHITPDLFEIVKKWLADPEKVKPAIKTFIDLVKAAENIFINADLEKIINDFDAGTIADVAPDAETTAAAAIPETEPQTTADYTPQEPRNDAPPRPYYLTTRPARAADAPTARHATPAGTVTKCAPQRAKFANYAKMGKYTAAGLCAPYTAAETAKTHTCGPGDALHPRQPEPVTRCARNYCNRDAAPPAFYDTS